MLTADTLQHLRNERAQPIFGISSYADERPASLDDAARNRRVELRFVLAYQADDAANSHKGASSALKRLQSSVR